MRGVDINDLIMARMIELAKTSTARLILRKRQKFDEDSDEESHIPKEKRDMSIKAPSMMRLYCNTVEVVRLRE